MVGGHFFLSRFHKNGNYRYMNLCDIRKGVIFAHFSLKEELRCICFYRGSVFQTIITEQHTNGKIEKRISNEGEKAEKSQVHIIYHPIRRRVHNHI